VKPCAQTEGVYAADRRVCYALFEIVRRKSYPSIESHAEACSRRGGVAISMPQGQDYGTLSSYGKATTASL
jgi:hypothetical protein